MIPPQQTDAAGTALFFAITPAVSFQSVIKHDKDFLNIRNRWIPSATQRRWIFVPESIETAYPRSISREESHKAAQTAPQLCSGAETFSAPPNSLVGQQIGASYPMDTAGSTVIAIATASAATALDLTEPVAGYVATLQRSDIKVFRKIPGIIDFGAAATATSYVVTTAIPF
ncbi:unnamed protein product [Dibothriocephalus latus]|uniref:Uncharacterized protein n=1 Tax=Dibothriocephalus latus TaxID=60516 RepID=A0A3P7NQ79_DIBLA|nr:unnamed protein product [Dibothriocephalus latus]